MCKHSASSRIRLTIKKKKLRSVIIIFPSLFPEEEKPNQRKKKESKTKRKKEKEDLEMNDLKHYKHRTFGLVCSQPVRTPLCFV